MPKFNWFKRLGGKQESKQFNPLSDYYSAGVLHETNLIFSDDLWEYHNERLPDWKTMIESKELILPIREALAKHRVFVMKILQDLDDPNEMPIYVVCSTKQEDTGYYRDTLIVYTEEEMKEAPGFSDIGGISFSDSI